MKKNILHIIAISALFFTLSGSLFSQSTIRVSVKSGSGGTPIEGAAITIGGDLVGLTDAAGNLSGGVGSGTNTLAAIYNGNTLSRTLTFAPGDNWMNFWFDPPDLPADFDGNYYHTMHIGAQDWMVENLLVTHYRDGTNIPNVTVNTQWSALSTAGYCWYNNDFDTYKNPYGALYNWYSASNGNICPGGWHVPSHTELLTLTNFLGGASVAGGKLKEAGTVHWESPNSGATNETGFTALPGGLRVSDGSFGSIRGNGIVWSSSEYVYTWGGWNLGMNFGANSVDNAPYDKRYGFSVRCLKDTLAALTTSPINSITQNSAKSGGNITYDGGDAVKRRGVCWSTSPNPNVTNDTTWNQNGIGSFTSSLSGLLPNTTYYLRAYAINSVGPAYGNELTFTTLSALPTVSTDAITIITPISALSGGNVTSEGGANVTTVGICWNTSQNPTISDNQSGLGFSGTGSFIRNVTNLDPNTTYYVRAYATNSAGTAYGNQVFFTTSQTFDNVTFNPGSTYGDITDIDGNIYKTIQIGTQLWMAENLKTTKYNDGTVIPLITDNTEWSNLTTPGYSWYKNQEATYKKTYGALYNWHTAITGNLCPTGWHVPTREEFDILHNNLGQLGGNGSMKEIGLTHWASPNFEATNTSGFTALPGGLRSFLDSPYQFDQIGTEGHFWYSTIDEHNVALLGYAKNNIIFYDRSPMWNFFLPQNYGFSIRCLQDKIIDVTNVNDNGVGSLRDAIVKANQDGNTDKINFKMPGIGPFIIKPSSPLPTIEKPVIIDGYSQQGASAAASAILIELDGTNAGPGADGLTITTSQCTVKGLIIKGFSGNGIKLTGAPDNRTGNRISANSIFNNGGLGIDLGGDGITLNDVGTSTILPDMDIGPNSFQNYPGIDKIVFSLGEVYINGHLYSTPGKNFILDFFASKLAGESGYGEGQTYLGSTTVTTDVNGNVIFTDKTFPYKTIYGDVITATATDAYGNTSEFSKAIGGLPDQTLNDIGLVYHVNPNDARIDTGSISAAVKSSFNTWNGITTANIGFKYGGTTTEKYAHIDGENVVSFSDDQYEFGDWVLAITAKTLELGATDAETKILDADIIFNPYFVNHQVWNFGIADDMPNAGFFDIQSITTHEIGHILGLLHTGVHNATMWFEMPEGINARSLEQDDKSWASYKYPSGSASSFGSISGNITYGYDGKPVAGALVLAINNATKDTIHSYSDALGNYLVPGLSTGSYNVHIEPLDWDVYGRPLSPRNISLYIYSNTIYTDYPGEFYSGANEKAVESTDIVTPVTVNTGSATSGINLITNQDVTPPVVVTVSPPDLSISQDIIIKFSEPVNISTFTGTTCYLVKAGDTKTIGGTYTILGSQTNIILYTPGEALNYNTSYTLHITTGVTDLAKIPNNLSAEYKFTFKTGKGDKTAPSIISTIPKKDASGVFVTTKIQLFFSEGMNTGSLTNSFSVTYNNSSGVVTNLLGSSSWDPEYKMMTFSPAGSLKEGTVYTVKVSTGARDISGNAMKSIFSFNFTTVLVANPTIMYLEPGSNLKSAVTVETPVVVDFSEPIDPNTIDLNTFKLFKGAANGIPVNGKFGFLNANSRVVFRPDVALDFSQSYTIELTNGIEDVSSPNVGTFQGTFATFTTDSKPGSPKIYFINPPSGIVGDKVTIGGKGFDPDPVKNKVEFWVDGLTYIQAKVTSASLTSLTVQVPVGAKSGRIKLTVNSIPADYLDPFDFYVVQEYSDICNTVIGSAQTGGNSRAVALDISGATAYVTNSGSNNVSVIDVASLTTKTTINVGEYPLMIDINPAGTRAYVTNLVSHTVSVIDLKTNTVTKTINVGYNPYGVAVSPDGKRVYVAHYNSEYQNVSVIDADPASGGFDYVVSNINTGTRNRGLAIDPNASMIVVTGDDGLKIIERIKTALGFDYSTSSASSGTKTRDVAIITEAGLAAVSTMDGALLFIDINKGSDTFGAVIANSKSGAKAGDVKPDVSGVFLYVSNPYDNQVTVYKMKYGQGGSGIESTQGLTLTEYWKIPVGMSPQGLTINTFNNELFVVNEFGTTGSTGSVTKVKICCAERSPSDDIVAVALYIQGLINTGAISETVGKMLINKLNDALSNVARGKTKTAINDLNTFLNKVNSSVETGKIPKIPGQKLIDDVNAIIAKLNGVTKSGEIESSISDAGLSQPAQISVSKLGLIYPNPFSESITINYELADNNESLNKVLLKVYDMNGRLVSTLIDQTMQPGRYTITWNGKYENGGLAPYGTYFVLFRNGNIEEVKAILLIK